VLGTPVAATYASSTVADVTATDTTTGAGAYLASLNYRWQYTNSDGAVTRLANAAAPTNIPLYAFQISQLDALGGKLAAGSTKAMVLELSGVGSLSYGALNSGAGGNAAYIAVPATTANDRVVYLYADGRSGTTTLTISVNGVVVKTYTVIFWGSVSTYTMTVNNAHIQPGIATDALTVTAKDKNGVIVPKATVNLTSSSTATATVPATVVTGNGASFALTPSEFAGAGSVDIPVTGVAAGTVTVTAANATSSATVTATGSTMVTTKQVAGIDWKFDKSNYEIGERATVTFTLTGSDGKPVGDGTYNVFGTDPSSNKALTAGTLPSGTLDTLSGVASVKVNMPVSPGTVTLSAVLGTSTDLAAALRGVATSISAEVGSSSIDAATEAAIEATDAANQAYEAAVVATETAEAAVAAAEEAKAAADAATAAVEALATEVAKLMAALKAQVTKLAATVAKILKLVK
jgi:hypothetical protein